MFWRSKCLKLFLWKIANKYLSMRAKLHRFGRGHITNEEDGHLFLECSIVREPKSRGSHLETPCPTLKNVEEKEHES